MMHWRILLHDTPDEAAGLRLLADGILRHEIGSGESLRIDTAETPEHFRRALCKNPFYYNMLIVGYHFAHFEQYGVLPELAKTRRLHIRQVLLFATSSRFLPAEMASLQCAGILKKPFQREDAAAVLQRAAEKCRRMEAGSGLPVDGRERTVILREGEILYGHKNRSGVRLITESAEYQVRLGMELLEEAKGLPLFRCHNSFIVNLRNVRAFDGRQFLLEGGAAVPVSRRYQPLARSLCRPVRR